jgi:Mu transposase-like protein
MTTSSPAVTRVLKGRDRTESDRFIALRSAAGDLADDSRVITGRTTTVGAAFEAEQPTLVPLPVEAFDPRILESRRVDQRARVSIRQCHYSVPARHAGRRMTVRLGKLGAVLPHFHGWEGLDVGKDGASPVSSQYDGTFPYQGHLDRVVFDPENEDVPVFGTVD